MRPDLELVCGDLELVNEDLELTREDLQQVPPADQMTRFISEIRLCHLLSGWILQAQPTLGGQLLRVA